MNGGDITLELFQVHKGSANRIRIIFQHSLEVAGLFSVDRHIDPAVVCIGLEVLLQEGLQLLDHENRFFFSQEILHLASWQRMCEAELERRYPFAKAQLIHEVDHIVIPRSRGDDAQHPGAFDPVQRSRLGTIQRLGHFFDQHTMPDTCVQRHGHPPLRILLKFSVALLGLHLPVSHRPAHMAYPRGCPQEHGELQTLRKLEGQDHHLLRLLRAGGLEHREISKLCIVPVVLFILTGVAGRIIGTHDHQPPDHSQVRHRE